MQGKNYFLRKLGSPKKSKKNKSKPGWEIRLETQIKNLQKQTKMTKQRKDAGICWEKRKRLNKKKKNNNPTWGNKPENTGEKKKIK